MSLLRLTGSRKEKRLARLVARGGTAVHLVPDTILATRDILTNLPTNTQAFMTREGAWGCHQLGEEDAVDVGRCRTSLVAEVQCRHCQPAEQP